MSNPGGPVIAISHTLPQANLSTTSEGMYTANAHAADNKLLTVGAACCAANERARQLHEQQRRRKGWQARGDRRLDVVGVERQQRRHRRPRKSDLQGWTGHDWADTGTPQLCALAAACHHPVLSITWCVCMAGGGQLGHRHLAEDQLPRQHRPATLVSDHSGPQSRLCHLVCGAVVQYLSVIAENALHGPRAAATTMRQGLAPKQDKVACQHTLDDTRCDVSASALLQVHQVLRVQMLPRTTDFCPCHLQRQTKQLQRWQGAPGLEAPAICSISRHTVHTDKLHCLGRAESAWRSKCLQCVCRDVRMGLPA